MNNGLQRGFNETDVCRIPGDVRCHKVRVWDVAAGEYKWTAPVDALEMLQLGTVVHEKPNREGEDPRAG